MCWSASETSYLSRLLTTYSTSPSCHHPQPSKHGFLVTLYHTFVCLCCTLIFCVSLLLHTFFPNDFFPFFSIAKLVAGSIVTDSLRSITLSFESSSDELQVQTACSPVFTPSLQCAAMLLNVSLRRLVLALEKNNKRKEEEVGVAREADSSKTKDGGTEEIHELEVSLN